MSQTIFLAGAAGAIGRALIPLLVDAGYTVHGTTRRAERAGMLEALGATPIIVDVFDLPALTAAMRRSAPDCVIHQLTDLPPALDPARMADAIVRNARVRDEGTRHLAEAAIAAGCGRMVAQSIAWVYADGPKPHVETQPIMPDAPGGRGITLRGVAALERTTLHHPGLAGAVLRYGKLYGPGTGFDAPPADIPLHVEAAAWAALLAVQHAAVGIFNVLEDSPDISNARARRELAWRPEMRGTAGSR